MHSPFFVQEERMLRLALEESSTSAAQSVFLLSLANCC
jgi:hypothetical protein